MTLEIANGRIERSSDPLDEAQFMPLSAKGTARGDRAHWARSAEGEGLGDGGVDVCEH
jgi:hypothetical protein